MIRLKSVEIDGFITSSQKVKLDFVDSNVICIYGDNGSGKTSFLEILFATFAEDSKILERYNVEKIKVKFVKEEIEIAQQVERLKEKYDREEDEDRLNNLKEEIANLEKNKNEIIKIEVFKDFDKDNNLVYNFEEFEKNSLNLTSIYLGIGRGIHKQDFKIPRSLIWSFFNANRTDDEQKKVLTGHQIDEFTDKFLAWITPEKIVIDDISDLDEKRNIYLPNITIDRVEALLTKKYKEAVLDAKNKIEKSLSITSLNFLTTNNIDIQNKDFVELREKLIYNKILLLEMFSKDKNIGIEQLFNNLQDNRNYLKNINSSQYLILKTIVDELQSEVEIYKEIKRFIDEYNSFLNYNKKLVINENGIFIAPNNHRLEKLSSGERHLLTFFATILLLGEEQEFILLDEPEISLDISWQEKLLSTVSKLAPNAQIIVASHSPSIMSDYFDESIEIKISNE